MGYCKVRDNISLPKNMKSLHHTELSNLLKEFRTRSGYTQKDLSDKLSKPQSYISKYESEEKILDYFEIREICKAMKIPFVTFVKTLEERINK